MWPVSNRFKQELRKPVHTISVKVGVLDTNLQPVEGGEFFDRNTNMIQNFVIEGNVDIDISRGTRRTAELTLLNDNEEFTPNDEWTGHFYVNRAIRIWRGVEISTGYFEYAPCGTFLVDHAEVITDRNMSLVTLALSDFWKKFTKSIITQDKKYVVGTHLNNIILEQAALVGADEPLNPVLDPLTGPERTDFSRKLSHDLIFKKGENRGDTLKKMCAAHGIDIFFDAVGRLNTNDRLDPRDKESVWSFTDASDGTGMLLTVRRSFTDDNLYNHVVGIGTGDPKHIVRYEMKNTDPDSRYNIDKIGDRVVLIETDKVKTLEAITQLVKLRWNKIINIIEQVTIETICNPALEGDDVIHLKEKKSNLKGHYRIANMNIPLVSTKQTIVVNNVIRR